MAGYIGTKAALLSTTTASVGGDSTVGGDLTVDTNTLYVDSANNRVGVGTSSPSNQLHVYRNTTDGSAASLILENAGTTGSYATLDAKAGSVQTFLYSDAAGNALGVAGATLRTVSDHPLLFGTSNTERMRIDASGRVTMPYQPSFRAHYNGGTIANGTVIGWNSTDFNTGGHYSTSTGRFTAPIAGKYAFFVQVHHAQGAGYTASHSFFDIRKNGGGIHRFIGRWTVDDWYELTAQIVVELAANDYVDVLVASANNQWMGSNRSDHNHFTGYLIG